MVWCVRGEDELPDLRILENYNALTWRGTAETGRTSLQSMTDLSQRSSDATSKIVVWPIRTPGSMDGPADAIYVGTDAWKVRNRSCEAVVLGWVLVENTGCPSGSSGLVANQVAVTHGAILRTTLTGSYARGRRSKLAIQTSLVSSGWVNMISDIPTAHGVGPACEGAPGPP